MTVETSGTHAVDPDSLPAAKMEPRAKPHRVLLPQPMVQLQSQEIHAVSVPVCESFAVSSRCAARTIA